MLNKLRQLLPLVALLGVVSLPASAECRRVFVSVCWVAPDGSCGCYSGVRWECDDLPVDPPVYAASKIPGKNYDPANSGKDDNDKSPEKPKRPWAFKREEDVVSA